MIILGVLLLLCLLGHVAVSMNISTTYEISTTFDPDDIQWGEPAEISESVDQLQ
jgi:hypothetical protein